MKIEVKFLITFLIAVILSIPVSSALERRTNQVKIEKLKNSKLMLDVKTKDENLKQKDQQILNEQNKSNNLQQQLNNVNNELSTQADNNIQPAVASIPQRPTASCASYRGLVSQYSWDVNVALAVMQAESGCDTNQDTTNDGHTTCLGSRGLFQIGCDSTANYAGMFDPATNIAQAYALYSTRGWQPWTVYTTGAYLKFL